MPRKARVQRRAARWLPWSPALDELFRLAGCMDWTPPKAARLSPGQSRMTLSARFTGEDGTVMTARIRLARDGVTGELDVIGEELSIPLGRISGRGSE